MKIMKFLGEPGAQAISRGSLDGELRVEGVLQAEKQLLHVKEDT